MALNIAVQKSFYYSFINRLASCTFGVYLIHDSRYIRPILWNDIFPNDGFITVFSALLVLLLETVTVFAVCTGIELLRQIIEKPIFKIIDEHPGALKAPFRQNGNRESGDRKS